MPRAVSSPELRGSSGGAPGVNVLHSFIRFRDPAVPRVPGMGPCHRVFGPDIGPNHDVLLRN
ncbi:hypothetical protein CH63R_10273 [Colletotrichum higginsianum IMI 349063]|uniref:Uncharacterized protein n=1 Tax=Colletotrichum higginsianum (strain IMI 349063) TaxID=759273 RepID=A0A1B7Y2A8_COLHI|nr:uncharacterized protein CH63R_10273 [Colletotrichum higginsianum IMI 349063]OBR06153.1 hypothetical protein CH63R_10273 [Colletotrichum higginsianum IMI 349063]